MKTILNQILQKKLNASSLQLQPVSGGSINQTYQLLSPGKSYFCKINSALNFPQLFEKEAEGLDLIRKQKIIKVPEVIHCFEESDNQFLILEWINEGERTAGFWKKFGEQLAQLHRVANDTFGLSYDNYMGSVPQSNSEATDWVNFFFKDRLKPLVEKCIAKNLLSSSHKEQFKNLYNKLPQIFSEEAPSLLHGDLWSGNFMCNENGDPVLIDPAVYYGHRSVDLGMTTLFGGFQKTFYQAYHHHFPFPDNYEEQWEICNLYPLLIHLYLFGGSYLPQIEHIRIRFA